MIWPGQKAPHRPFLHHRFVCEKVEFSRAMIWAGQKARGGEAAQSKSDQDAQFQHVLKCEKGRQNAKYSHCIFIAG